MPLRLILFILVFAVVILFVTFNLSNKSDISLVLKTIPDVPVFVTVFISFFLGMICALPFVYGAKSKKKEARGKYKKEKPGKGPGTLSESSEYADRKDYGID